MSENEINVKSHTFIVLLNAIDQLQIQNIDGQMLNWFLCMKSETANFFHSTTYPYERIMDKTSIRTVKQFPHLFNLTVIFLSFRTDRSGQTVQTQIRLLLVDPDQSDQGLHCLQFPLHLLDVLL